MITAIQSLLKKYTEVPQTTGAGREEALRMAVAILLMETARSEDGVSVEERTLIRKIIERQNSIPPEQASEIVDAAERDAEQVHSLHPFTRQIVENCSIEERTEIIGMLWEVTFADGHAGAHEQHLVRKVAGLLHVPHREFIRMKLQQQAAQQ